MFSIYQKSPGILENCCHVLVFSVLFLTAKNICKYNNTKINNLDHSTSLLPQGFYVALLYLGPNPWSYEVAINYTVMQNNRDTNNHQEHQSNRYGRIALDSQNVFKFKLAQLLLSVRCKNVHPRTIINYRALSHQPSADSANNNGVRVYISACTAATKTMARIISIR